MDDMQEAAQTVMKLSPPMLIIIGAAFVNLLLKPFLPEKYLAPIATVGGAAVAPYLFSPAHLAYDVPSPGTALVMIGGIMGFVGAVVHRRLGRWFKSKMFNGDTDYFIRSDADPAPRGQPSSPDARHTTASRPQAVDDVVGP